MRPWRSGRRPTLLRRACCHVGTSVALAAPPCTFSFLRFFLLLSVLPFLGAGGEEVAWRESSYLLLNHMRARNPNPRRKERPTQQSKAARGSNDGSLRETPKCNSIMEREEEAARKEAARKGPTPKESRMKLHASSLQVLNKGYILDKVVPKPSARKLCTGNLSLWNPPLLYCLPQTQTAFEFREPVREFPNPFETIFQAFFVFFRVFSLSEI